MFHLCKFKLILFFVIVAVEIISGAIINDTLSKQLSEGVVKDLYKNYREVIGNGTSKESLRRLFTNNKEYKIHVKKLKEVNGYKPHNLYIEEESILGKPLVYFNNPVESRFPNPYLTLTEFQDQLTGRIQKQKDDIAEKNANRLTKPRNNIKDREIIEEDTSKEGISKIYKPTRTNSILRNNIIINGTDIKGKKHVKRETSQQTTTKLLKKGKLRNKINSTNQIKRVKVTNKGSKSPSLSVSLKIEKFNKTLKDNKRLRSKSNSTIRGQQLKLRNTDSKIHNAKLINKINPTGREKKKKLRNKIITTKGGNKKSAVRHVKQSKLTNKKNGTIKRMRQKQNKTKLINKLTSLVKDKPGKIQRTHSKVKSLRHSTVKSKKDAAKIKGLKNKHKVQNRTSKVKKDSTTVLVVQKSNVNTVNETETITSSMKISFDNTTADTTVKSEVADTNSEVTTVTSNNETGGSIVPTSEIADGETKASDAEVTTATANADSEATTADETTTVEAEVTSQNADEEKETTTHETTTLSTKSTWKTLGRPAVYMGGSGFD